MSACEVFFFIFWDLVFASQESRGQCCQRKKKSALSINLNRTAAAAAAQVGNHNTTHKWIVSRSHVWGLQQSTRRESYITAVRVVVGGVHSVMHDLQPGSAGEDCWSWWSTYYTAWMFWAVHFLTGVTEIRLVCSWGFVCSTGSPNLAHYGIWAELGRCFQNTTVWHV